MRQKKLWGFILSAALVLGSTLTAQANTREHTITIENSRKDHVYEAYQVFSGDWTQEGTGSAKKDILSNVAWGSGVNGDALLAELKTDELLRDAFGEVTGAAGAAAVLEEIGKTASGDRLLDRFGELAWKHTSGTAAGVSEETQSPYTIDVTGDGYYLIKDKTPASGTYPEGDAATRYMLQVVGDVTVTAKADAPSLEKKILEADASGEDAAVDASRANIGDTVRYQLTSRVPHMDGYEKYFFIVHDTLSAGLTFDAGSVHITVGGSEIPAADFQVVTEDLEDDCTFEIVFKDFLNKYKDDADEEILITYGAAVNEHAEIGTAGNENEAQLEYSNNPNITPEGTDRPSDEDHNVTGKTPKDLVLTYVSGIRLAKVDAADTAKKLAGAQFTLTGTSLNKVIISTTFKEDADGSWYRLKDGSYTQEDPGESRAADLYESTDTRYAKVTSQLRDTKTVTAAGIADENGILEFKGLGAGTYTITEIAAPDGYNLLKDPITVTLAARVPETVASADDAAEWRYTLESGKTEEEILQTGNQADEGIVSLEVKNEKGALLPSTGGMGTGLFYLGGALLMMAGGLLFFRGRKRRGV